MQPTTALRARAGGLKAGGLSGPTLPLRATSTAAASRLRSGACIGVGAPVWGSSSTPGPGGAAVGRVRPTTRGTVPPGAVANPDAPSQVAEKSFQLRNGANVWLTLGTTDSGDQSLRMVTDLDAGKLLLHWGVEGGKDYKGGWRLPGDGVRPAGTVAYKDRALQSPWKRGSDDGRLEITIELKGDEASDVFNFVLKDEATNSWYDNAGSNFAISLRPGHGGSMTVDEDNSEEEDVVLPKELCDKWAWFRWDSEGRQQGDAEQSTRQYDEGVIQIKTLLAAGRSMDELWQVANGAANYSEFCKAHLKGYAPAKQPEQKQPEQKQEQKQPEQKQEQKAPAAQKTDEKKKAPPGPPADLGKPLDNKRARNPLDLIKRAHSDAPKLSEGSKKVELPLDFLAKRFAEDPTTKWKRRFGMGGKSELLAVVRHENESQPVRVDIFTDLADKAVVHWGINKPGTRKWSVPPEEFWPEGTDIGGHTACDTKLLDCVDDECDVEISGSKVPLQRVTIWLPPDHTVASLSFVLRSADSTMWWKDAGKDFFVPVPGKFVTDVPADKKEAELPDRLTKTIVEAENSSAWTLMHRFNKAADVLSEVLNGYYEELPRMDAMAYVYVWLRYSAIRQLTWQRNYNTQPRILSAAQERLTNAIASAHSKTSGEAQEWVRTMLATVGRGGDGQKIRDEILQIMHRNHVSEAKGHWMEQWHQKLHNNTTPDDVPICAAYIAFLEGGGNNGAYWSVLSDAGLTRERLEGFDRPLTHEPQTYDKAGQLIPEFKNYLKILKAVHSGADMQASAAAAGNRIPDGARGYLGYVMSHLGSSQILPLMEAAVEARSELAPVLNGNRELLYLDLALEDQVRQAAERGVSAAGFGAAAFMKPLLQNLCLSLGDNEELCYCLKTWEELPASVRSGGRLNKEDALQAVAVVNRIRRAISEVSDRIVTRIGAQSKAMGDACGADNWASELFAEEVVRGGPAFAVSLVISSVEPVLRNAAALGAWQVISPNPATGVVVVVSGLDVVQDKTYTVPTVLIAEQVTGEEEIPEGCIAVLTPDAPDVLSHVSVRARNMKVLFATCHDDGPLNDIRAMAGKTLHFTTTASGSVSFAEAQAGELDAEKTKQDTAKSGLNLKISVPTWPGKWAVSMDEYKQGVCGAKSNNLAGLRGRLPPNIKLPASVTLPFGCYEQVLDMSENSKIKSELKALVSRLNAKPKQSLLASMASLVSMDNVALDGDGLDRPVDATDVLAQCRALAMQVAVPDTVRDQLGEAMKAAGIPLPNSAQRWSQAMEALKGVWASKYNDRAYYSLRKVNLNFDDVRMAVLVQGVVPAKYAFVIHTKNPSNNDENEVFCELVQGLGESLVSGMIPGSAIAFKARKDALDAPEVLCYASKSEGMFVPESLIFRSDSNGEDLEGYAGAGLYESITMDTTVTRRVDYMDDKLVQDPAYRTFILSEICKVGYAIEQALGSAQDIEGVVGEDNTITIVQTRPQV
ncbi:hypothetical protein FOA52_007392 [Chlamydomonas sp. UWO 241]|nr:hypothetical protein FOA52_007392 [Chlamydomonas sp. UWO 241]